MGRILLFGGTGILGSEVLQKLQNEEFEYFAPKSSDVDIRDLSQILAFTRQIKPTWIINCAGWTNVDGAEEFFERSCELNETAVKNIGMIASEIGCQVIHISTDYVFDGKSSVPYDEMSQVNPINKYGESKLRGELELLKVLPTAYVIRTSWLYGSSGKNFVKTLAGRAIRGERAKVVIDQIGSPTSSMDLAAGIFSVIEVQPKPGIYNYSNEGSCSWFELACSIYEKIEADITLVEPTKTSQQFTKAKRPAFSLLSKNKWKAEGLGLVPNWEESLESALPGIIEVVKQ